MQHDIAYRKCQWHGVIGGLDVQMKQMWNDEIIGAKTRCWAQGMDGWRALQLIPQLKWCLLATGQAVMNETQLATLILNMLIRMCEYYPSRCAHHRLNNVPSCSVYSSAV